MGRPLEVDLTEFSAKPLESTRRSSPFRISSGNLDGSFQDYFQVKLALYDHICKVVYGGSQMLPVDSIYYLPNSDIFIKFQWRKGGEKVEFS